MGHTSRGLCAITVTFGFCHELSGLSAGASPRPTKLKSPDIPAKVICSKAEQSSGYGVCSRNKQDKAHRSRRTMAMLVIVEFVCEEQRSVAQFIGQTN